MSDAGEHTVAEVAYVLTAPLAGSALRSQVLPGESVVIVEAGNEYCRCEMPDTDVAGFIRRNDLVYRAHQPTHIVSVPFVHVYSQPAHEAATRRLLPLNSLIACTGERAPLAFPSGNASSDALAMADGGWIPEPSVRSLSGKQVSVGEAAMALVNAPYLAGGRTHHGYDEGGLIEAAMTQGGYVFAHLQREELLKLLTAQQRSGSRGGKLFRAAETIGIFCGEDSFVHGSPVSRMVVSQSASELSRETGIEPDEIVYLEPAKVS